MELRKVDENNIWELIKLKVADNQTSFVATNTQSILEAYVTVTSGGVALPFGLYEDGVPVGFVMFGYCERAEEGEPAYVAESYSLWRFMIDERYQRRGLGKKALQAALDYLRDAAPCGRAPRCWLSYEPENSTAAALYRAFGFRETGDVCEGEVMALREL